MKKLLLTLAAIPFAIHAVEASAQTNANAGGTVAIQNRIANLEARFNAGINARAIDPREQSIIRARLNELRNLERSYSANGLTRRERNTLQQRIRAVRDELRLAGGSWANRYGWNDRDLDAYPTGYGTTYASDAYGRPITTAPRYDAYGRPITTIPRYDAYGRLIPDTGVAYDQYGRPVASGYYGQGGPYEPVPSTGVGGIGGILGSILGAGSGSGSMVGGLLGSILGNGGLNIGDVVTGTIGSVLGGVPSTLSSQFRNSSNVYYRSDGQRIYEIDARTNRVLHIYPMQ